MRKLHTLGKTPRYSYYIPKYSAAERAEKRAQTRAAAKLRRLERKTQGAGAWLRLRRYAAGCTRRELADATGIPRSVIVAYENGAYLPSGARLAMLCRYFKITTNALFTRPPDDVIKQADAAILTKHAAKARTAYRLRQQFWDGLVSRVDLGEVATRIRTQREALGITKRALAATLGVPVGLITRYEAGTAMPSHHKGPQLADALNFTIQYLYTGRR